MVKRVVAAAAVGAVALVLVATGARAQTYPPPANSITVDDPTPAPGQAVTVTLKTCRPGTFALIGVDLVLLATPRVSADGVARATITIPPRTRPGRHVVTGVCIGPNWQPVVQSTYIQVTAAAVPGGGGQGGGTGAGAPGGGSGTAGSAGATAAAPGGLTGSSSGVGAAGGTGGGPRPAMPSLDGLAAPAVPPDVALVYENASLAGGPTDGADAVGGTPRGDGDGAGEGDGGPGPLGTIARVAFGLLAIGGVPVALAFSRGSGPAVFGGRFAPQ